jgi:hypothetical protein
MSNLNDEIRAAIDTSDVDRARALLREALNDTPDADTYYLASLVALSDDQKQRFLKKATELDPFHSEAHAALGATAQNKPAAPAPQETAPATTAPSFEPPAETAETTTANASQTATPDTAQPEKPAGIHWGRAIVVGLLLLLIPVRIAFGIASSHDTYQDTIIAMAIAFWLSGVLWAGKYGRRSWTWLAVCMSPNIIPLLTLASIPESSRPLPGPMLVLAAFIIGAPLVGAVFPAFLLTLVWRDQPPRQHQPTPANN